MTRQAATKKRRGLEGLTALQAGAGEAKDCKGLRPHRRWQEKQRTARANSPTGGGRHQKGPGWGEEDRASLLLFRPEGVGKEDQYGEEFQTAQHHQQREKDLSHIGNSRIGEYRPHTPQSGPDISEAGSHGSH